MALQDLSKELPTEADLKNYLEYIVKESDRGAAVMAAALVEKALEDAIRCRIAAPEGGLADTWFEGINAPFRTFSAKITLGRAIGVYGPQLEQRLISIKNIRNAFAHRMIPLDFKHPTLAEECHKLSYVKDNDPDVSPKVLYGAVCTAIAHQLGSDSQKRGEAKLFPAFP